MSSRRRCNQQSGVISGAAGEQTDGAVIRSVSYEGVSSCFIEEQYFVKVDLYISFRQNPRNECKV